MHFQEASQAYYCISCRRLAAFTERTVITDPAFAEWTALGLAGDIMPRSRTSVSWHRE